MKYLFVIPFLLSFILLSLTSCGSGEGNDDNSSNFNKPLLRTDNNGNNLRKKRIDTTTVKPITIHDTIRETVEVETPFKSERLTQIEEILSYMYQTRLVELDKVGVSQDMINTDSKMYNVETTSNKILLQLDRIIRDSNLKLAEKLAINYKALMADSIDVIKVRK